MGSIVALLFMKTVCLFVVSYTQAGLLGCEAVLSSMALMQAGSMPNHKKMGSHLGHGQRENNHSHNHNNNHNHNQDTQNQHGHMVLPSGVSCPPLVRKKDINRVKSPFRSAQYCSHLIHFRKIGQQNVWFKVN